MGGNEGNGVANTLLEGDVGIESVGLGSFPANPKTDTEDVLRSTTGGTETPIPAGGGGVLDLSVVWVLLLVALDWEWDWEVVDCAGAGTGWRMDARGVVRSGLESLTEYERAEEDESEEELGEVES